MNTLSSEPTIHVSQSCEPGTWNYVSGRISVFETMLLPRSFFEALSAGGSVGEARSTLSKTAYRNVFATDEQVLDYAGTVESFLSSRVNTLLDESPPHVIKSFFALNRRYLFFRQFFRRSLSRGSPSDDTVKAFLRFIENHDREGELETHLAIIRTADSFPSDDRVAGSLVLDSAACTLLIHLAESVPEKPLSGLLRDYAVLRCWLAVLRHRWNSTGSETIARWFVLPHAYDGFVRDTVKYADAHPFDALSGFISDRVLGKLRDTGIENVRFSIDKAVQDTLHDDVFQLRFSPYGPDKVASYIMALGCEADNLRLALAAVVYGIDPAVVTQRFRRDYA